MASFSPVKAMVMRLQLHMGDILPLNPKPSTESPGLGYGRHPPGRPCRAWSLIPLPQNGGSYDYDADINIGALMIRIGCWGYYTIVMMRNPQSSIGNSLGPYITVPNMSNGTTRWTVYAEYCLASWQAPIH